MSWQSEKEVEITETNKKYLELLRSNDIRLGTSAKVEEFGGGLNIGPTARYIDQLQSTYIKRSLTWKTGRLVLFPYRVAKYILAKSRAVLKRILGT